MPPPAPWSATTSATIVTNIAPRRGRATNSVTGYNVTYRYQGHDYTDFLPYDPGRTVKVNVKVSLAERY